MLLIADPQSWAASQGYNLRPIQDINYSVFFGHRPLGALVKVAGGFKFVSECSTPEADVDYSQNSDTAFVSNSFGICDTEPTEGTNFNNSDKELTLGSKISGTGQTERISECNFWLPYAAEHYHLSRNIRDYVLVPIPSIYSGLPNTNGDSLSLQEMLRFDPQIGMQMYKSFRGKPTYLEHDNRNITKAKGVILDSFLRPVPFNPGYYKIVLLLAYDRTKDPVLVNNILTRQTNAYSVGFMYSSYSCSVCGTRVGRGLNLRPCSHTQLGKPTYRQADGQIVFRRCENANGFECSSVGTPAFVSAIGPHVYDTRSL